MFYGEFKHTLDRKGRVIVPSRFRDALKEHCIEKFYVTRGLDKCLFMFTEDEWKIQEQRFKGMSFTKSEARRFNRLFFSGACDLVPDKQGRILIPPYLKEYAAIKRDIYIIGISNRIELWSKEVWEGYYSESKDSFESVAEKLIELE